MSTGMEEIIDSQQFLSQSMIMVEFVEKIMCKSRENTPVSEAFFVCLSVSVTS